MRRPNAGGKGLRGVALAFVLVPLAACVNPAEMRAQQAEADRTDCEAQGFEAGSEQMAMCRLILRLERRVAHLESEIRFLEHDLWRANAFHRPYPWYY